MVACACFQPHLMKNLNTWTRHHSTGSILFLDRIKLFRFEFWALLNFPCLICQFWQIFHAYLHLRERPSMTSDVFLLPLTYLPTLPPCLIMSNFGGYFWPPPLPTLNRTSFMNIPLPAYHFRWKSLPACLLHAFHAYSTDSKNEPRDLKG